MNRPAAPAPSHDSYLARKYFPELDGLRAVCVFLVVSVHLYDTHILWKWLSGARGVTVFFLLSGYLITTLALREEAEHGRVSLAAFYVRRCCRLLPLYYLTLAAYCVLILGLGVGAALGPTLRDALPYYLLYLQEIPFYAYVATGLHDLPFYQSWSLGVEEKFYLAWPLLAFALWRGAAGRRRVGAAVLTAAFAAAPAVLLLFAQPGMRSVGRCLFCYFHILAGCLLALLLHDRRWFARLRPLGRWTAAALFVFLGVHFTTPWVTEPLLAHGVDVLYTLTATAFLACLLLGDGPIQRALRCGPLVFVGRLSYGVYLVHMLCMVAVYKAVAAYGTLGLSVAAYAATFGLSVLVAWVLYWSVEKRGIELGRRWSRALTERSRRQAAPSREQNVAGSAEARRLRAITPLSVSEFPSG